MSHLSLTDRAPEHLDWFVAAYEARAGWLGRLGQGTRWAGEYRSVAPTRLCSGSGVTGDVAAANPLF
jgi:hypothetical protein